MESVAPPENEAERLRAVRSLRVPKSDRTQRVPGLDAIVEAAARACGQPVAAVVVVDDTKVFMLAAHGLPAMELPRDGAFCACTIMDADILEVRDASKDPRFRDVDLVTKAPCARFYAGAPLTDRSGFRLGTLCVLGTEPSQLTDAQRIQLRTLADAVVEILQSNVEAHVAANAPETDAERFAQPSSVNQNALRTLAAGVGHEINNPLSFVATNLDFAVDELRMIATSHPALAQTLEEVVASISEAKDGAQRIRKIVRGLQSFANQETPKAPTNVQSALEAAAEMARNELRHKASLDVHVENIPPMPPVLADDGGLTHVVVNLLVNATQSFETQDPLTNVIELRAFRRDDTQVSITVTDNGPGIPASVLPRIFDPFFTTRPVGHGSGLGLSLCHTIVSAFGGELRCETELGKGTTFVVNLPIATSAVRASELPRSGTAPITRGRILLVDDEESLLRAMTRLLRQDHEVVATADPRAALRMLLDEAETFDVIFCDLMMPHLTGMDLFRNVQAKRSHVAERFVFMTAGAISDDASVFLAESRNPRVDKPFSSQALRALAIKLVSKFGMDAGARISNAGTE